MAVVHFVEIGEERLGRITVRAARRGAMELPKIMKSRRFVDDLPVLRVTAFPFTVVHYRGTRTDCMHQLRCSRMGIAMACRMKDSEGADQVARAGQFILLVPGQITEVEKPKIAVLYDDPDGFKVLRRGILILKFGIAAERIRRPLLAHPQSVG